MASKKVRVAIIGVGNCASSLVQGVEFYKNTPEDASVPGLMHVNLGGYHIRDIEFTAAFDVVVTPNMFGDVLGDVAALLLGSRGMSYSFNVNEVGNAVYQTAHGAAYDLAGSGTANPLGQIQSLAALLRESFGLFELADKLFTACNAVLAKGLRTADILAPGSKLLSTLEMGQAVALELGAELGSGNSARGWRSGQLD